MRRLAGVAIAFACLAGAPAAAAQSDPADASVLLVLDSSKSMNEPADGAATRLDAAKDAARELVRTLPDRARVGVRVYGAKVADASRAEGCRDTELVVPVAPLDRERLTEAIDGLEGRGRTPIGRSLLAAADDLPASGERTVILVSDGGDNCAPPNPCRAAEEVSRRGVDLSIQVVGLQVNERVRRQLRCIARAGGGTYVDAADAGELREKLLAAFARAFRGYEPSGTRIQGGPSAQAAAKAAPGRWLDEITPGQARWYSVDVPEGKRLLASATVVAPPAATESGTLDIRLVGPDGEELAGDRVRHEPGRGEPVTPVSVTMEDLRGGTEAPPGRYAVGVSIDNAEPAQFGTVPMELEFHVRGPGEPVEPSEEGRLPTDPTPTPTPTREEPERVPADRGGSDVVELAGIGIVGGLIGLAAGALASRRRRR